MLLSNGLKSMDKQVVIVVGVILSYQSSLSTRRPFFLFAAAVANTRFPMPFFNGLLMPKSFHGGFQLSHVAGFHSTEKGRSIRISYHGEWKPEEKWGGVDKWLANWEEKDAWCSMQRIQAVDLIWDQTKSDYDAMAIQWFQYFATETYNEKKLIPN